MAVAKKAGRGRKRRPKRGRKAPGRKRGGKIPGRGRSAGGGLKKIDLRIVHDEPAFGRKHPLCAEVAHFYSLPGQMNLVLHGVPFHLIEDQFVRFHAVQSTIIGWKFTIIYTLMLACAFANSLIFSNRYLEWIVWAFIAVAAVHAGMNLFLAYKTKRGEEASIPFLAEMARRIAG